jgi:glycosyltransferase involved in cell wall biosynthesis
MTVAVYASEEHYLNHVLPVWRALPPALQGPIHVPRYLAAAVGGPCVPLGGSVSGFVLVAAWQDLHRVRRAGARAVFVEHGAGQTYQLDETKLPHRSYSGGGQREGVVLYLVPGPAVAARCLVAQPDVPVVEIGTPAYLDPILRGPPAERTGTPVVAVSFHPDLTLCPETRWTFPYYADAVARLAERTDLSVIGHGHPRAWATLERWYRQHGIEPVADFVDVVRRADVYVCDNSSSLPEAAACGLPLVWLNGPGWRRDVSHEGRFWTWPRGQIQVDDPADLDEAVDAALRDSPEIQIRRRAMVDGIYTHRDGRTAERAVDAILVSDGVS